MNEILNAQSALDTARQNLDILKAKGLDKPEDQEKVDLLTLEYYRLIDVCGMP